MVEVSRLREDDWQLWRTLRRSALTEAPDAFEATLAEWTGDGDSELRWRDRLRTVPLNVVAFVQGQPSGMVSATMASENEAKLISMWVAPHCRSIGIGDALVGAVIGWAEENDVQRIVLDVRQSNLPAIALYRRNRFIDDGWADEEGGSLPTGRMIRHLRH